MSGSSITDFQVEVARVFFAMPEAGSFLLAGDVAVAVEAFTRAATDRQWIVETVTESETFVRLSVVGQDDLIVDIGLDSPPDLPPTMSLLGPTFAPRELAARKLLALFDRAMPRDFVDVFRLVQRWDRDELKNLARAIDQGFDDTVLAIAMRQLDRYRNDDIPIAAAELPELRSYFHAWVDDLASAGRSGHQRSREDS